MTFIDTAALMAEEENTHRVQMVNHEREVLYSHHYSMGEWTEPPYLTRYHRGPYRPGVRQQVEGSPSFSSWQSMHGTATRQHTIDRTNLNRAQAKPIRLWDRGSYPQSVPPTTFQANPSQRMYGSSDASGYQLPLTARGY